MIWIWVAIVVVSVSVVLLSPVSMQLVATRMKQNDHLELKARALFGLVNLRYEIPIVKFNGWQHGVFVHTEQGGTGISGSSREQITAEKIKLAYQNLRELVTHTFQLNDWVKDTLARVKIVKLRWESRLGVGDAADTAVTTGVVWGLKSSLLGFVFQFLQLDAKPKIAVIPQFNQVHFSSDFVCVAQISVARALQAGIVLVYRIAKSEGGFKAWRNIMLKRKLAGPN